jgi:hypothetical protein
VLFVSYGNDPELTGQKQKSHPFRVAFILSVSDPTGG